MGSHIPTLRPKCLPYTYMDPLGKLEPQNLQRQDFKEKGAVGAVKDAVADAGSSSRFSRKYPGLNSAIGEFLGIYSPP